MELGQVLEQRPTVTPQLILANTLLQLSSAELEQTIAEELAENPVLELVEVRRCLRCGLAMSGDYCPSCGRRGLSAEKDESAYREYNADSTALSEYNVADERDDDGISRLASITTLSDHLLHQARLSLPPQDLPIAAHLVQSLDEHGFLRCELDEVASLFGVDRTRVESVVS
nr:hypothetical protein [Anaerolineae bacterium]